MMRRVLELEYKEHLRTIVYKKEDSYLIRRMIRRGIHHDVVSDLDGVHAQVVDDSFNGFILIFNELFPLGVDECVAHQRKKYQEKMKDLQVDDEPDLTKTDPLKPEDHVATL